MRQLYTKGVVPWQSMQIGQVIVVPCDPERRIRLQMQLSANLHHTFGPGCCTTKQVEGGVRIERVR